MIKTIYKIASYAILAILVISLLLSGWTTFTLISDMSKRSEISNILGNMYKSQKAFLFDTVKLSNILLRNEQKVSSTKEEIPSENATTLTNLNDDYNENDLNKDKIEDTSDIEIELSSNEDDNGDNPLGIVITQNDSIPELENK